MRFAVLGSGFWATEVHAASLAAHPDAELVGIWGRDAARRPRPASGTACPGRRTWTRCWPTSTR